MLMIKYPRQSRGFISFNYLTDKKQKIPIASHPDKVKTNMGEFVNLVRVELKEEHAVRRTVSIPIIQ
jgi:hypothetical protein